jgi:hypothetical protein
MTVTREVAAPDVAWVFPALSSWERCHVWSARGCTPNLRYVHERLFSAPPWQAVIEAETRDPIALLQITVQDEIHRYGQTSLLLAPWADELAGGVLTGELRVAMARLGLRKLCFSCVDGEMDAGRWFGDAVSMVGRLSRHERQVDGSYADLLMHEIWTDRR